MTYDVDKNSLYSTYREVLLEHLLVGEIMKHLWLQGSSRMEILKPQVDDSGYDIVFEARSTVRHIQLKSTFKESKVREIKVNTQLAKKPSGCIIWTFFDPSTLNLCPFYWFGDQPGMPLPDISLFPIAKYTK